MNGIFSPLSDEKMAPPPPMAQPALPPMREVTEDTPPDMLAGAMDLRVLLPDGHAVKMNVDRSTPMMDLLVHVTTANKMSPGSHVIQAVGEKGNMLPYKPSTPIGALDTWTIQIVSKTKASGVGHKKAPLKPSNQPFEQTFRLQVNLPRNQLFVTRVSPRTPLLEVLRHVCSEKGLDPDKYDLRNPVNPDEVLRLTCNLLDYKLQEVTVALRGSTVPHNHHSHHRIHATSAADIISLQHHQQLTEVGDKRRKSSTSTTTTSNSGGVFGFIFKRGSRSSVCEGSVSSDSLGGQSISPARSDESLGPARSASPPLPQAPSRAVSGAAHDHLRNQINSQMSRRQENSSRPISVVSENGLKQHMDESQPPPLPVRHRKRRAPKPPMQNAEMSSGSKKTSDFITPAPPSVPAPIPVARRKSTPVDDDEDEYDEEDVVVGNVVSGCKTKGDGGGATTGGTLISHSRNSSDSSGYHEASVLSESPESGLGGSGAPDTLPRRKQQHQLQQQRSAAGASTQLPPFSRSMGNLASAGPPSSTSTTSSKTLMSSSSYSSLSASTSSLPSQKKKKAPAPPPPVVSEKQQMNEVAADKPGILSSKNAMAPSTSSLDRTRQAMNEKKDEPASHERDCTYQPKVNGKAVSEPLKSDLLVKQSAIHNSSSLEKKVPNSQVPQKNHVDPSSEKSALCPVDSASKPANVNKSGPAVAPKPHPKVHLSGVSQRPIFQNGQGSQEALPIPMPRSKPPMPKKRVAPSPAPRAKSDSISDAESESEKLAQGKKDAELPSKAGLLSNFSAFTMVPKSVDLSEGLPENSPEGMANSDTRDECDDLDMELFDGGKVENLNSDEEASEEEEDKSVEEEFDEEVIRKVLLDREQRTFAEALDARIKESVSEDEEVILNSQDVYTEGFCFERKRTLGSEMKDGRCSQNVTGPDRASGLASAKTERVSRPSRASKTSSQIRQVESAINFSNLGEGVASELNGSSRFSSNSLCSEVDMPFTNGGGAAKMNRWQNMESLNQSSSTSSMEKRVKEMFAFRGTPLEEDYSISANWVVGSESDNEARDVSEVASTDDTADNIIADSVDEVDDVRQQVESAVIEEYEEAAKHLDLSEKEQKLNYDHPRKVNGINISSTLLPSPPPSLEYIGPDDCKSFETEGRCDGLETEELEWEYKLPAPPTGFEDEEERRDGAEEVPKKKEEEKERETWVAESETVSIPSTFSSTSHRKTWMVDTDTQPVQHLPNFRMSTYKLASDDGWENPREDLGNQRKVVEDGLGKSNGRRTFVMLNSDCKDKVEKEVGPKKSSFETWASVSSKSSHGKTHSSNLDLYDPSPCNNNSSSVMTCFKDTVERGVEPHGPIKNGSYVVRVSSFGGKSSMALKRSLSSTSSLVSRHSSNDGRDLGEKQEKEVDGDLTHSVKSQSSRRNGIENHSLLKASRTVSLHDLAISSIQEESRVGESLSNGYHKENTTPKIVSSKWKKPQVVSGESPGRFDPSDSHNLRKTSSELSISQAGHSNGWKEAEEEDEHVALLQQQFLQWHEQMLQNKITLDGNVQVPLKSLQVLRGVLPQLKKTLSSDFAEKDTVEKLSQMRRDGFQSKVEERGVDEAEIRNNEEEVVNSLSASTESNYVPSSNYLVSSAEATPQEAETPKRYSYAGPPAINFGTWSERPKSEVSLKRDNDYRIGVGQAPRLKESYSHLPLNPTAPVRPCKPTSPSQSSNPQTDNGPPCPPPKPASTNRVVVNIVSAAKQEPVSRLPIVRSVELKKTAQTVSMKTAQSGPRPVSGNFPNDLREELTGALASLVDANRNGEAKAAEEVNERRKRQQIPCSSVAPPPPPDVVAMARHSMATQGTNLRRMGSAAGLECGPRVNGFGGHEKRHPIAPVVKGFRLNTIAAHPAAAPQAPPPPPAVVCGVALKKRVEPSSIPKVSGNPRDQLLSAIREFGGRENLKKTAIHYK